MPTSSGSHERARRGVSSVPSQDYLRQLHRSHEQSRLAREQLMSRLVGSPINNEVSLATKTPVKESTGLGNPDLPIFKYKSELLETIENNRATLLIGATGSGKSTQLAQFLLEGGYDHIFGTEPRKIMADSIGERIRFELNESDDKQYENTVGIVHGERSERHSDNKITLVTPYTLILMMPEIERAFKGKKVAFIPDELHEDDPQTEMAFARAAMAVRDNDTFRIIGASATINAETLKKPMGRVTNQTAPLDVTVPVFEVEGRPFDVTMHAAPGKNPAEAYLEFGSEHAVSILSTKGQAEISNIITAVKEGLEKTKKGSSDNYIFSKISGETSTYQRLRIAELAKDLPEGKQLVVVASPAARSGITIPNATFAATDGMVNREIRNEDNDWGLEAQYFSQAELIQIAGRVGRDVPGGVAYICDPMPKDTRPRRIEQHKELYPYLAFEDRPEYPTPAIYNTNISGMVLEAASSDIDYTELNDYMISPVNAATIQNAKTRLSRTFGALDVDGKITPIGRSMKKFPVVSELSRGIAESLERGRSPQHMARTAFIAAAVDTGGLQEYRHNSGDEWRNLLRSGADDDFIAQLDIMLALNEADRESESLREKYLFARAYDLNTKRVESAQKSAGKILRRLGIDASTFEIEPPSYKEIADLREDFTAGMFDQAYRDDGMQGKERVYTHVRDDKRIRHRTISKRSVTEPTRGQIIAGIGQHYQDTATGKVEVKNILTMTLNVEPSVIGRFALQNRLVDYKPMPSSARINGGMVIEREQIVFGSLHLGSREVSKGQSIIPIESQKALVRHALQNPGPAQLAMRSTADELAEYRRILPAAEIEKYRKKDASVDITKKEIEHLLRHYAARTRNMQELDALLGEHSYQKNISIEIYYDSNARLSMLQRSPDSLDIGGVETEIRYDNGKPYVTQKITKQQDSSVTSAVYLEDGREVLRQVLKQGGRGTRRVSFGEELEAN